MTDFAGAPHRRLPASALPLAAGLVAAAWYGSYMAFGSITQDEAWLLECATRVQAGQVPHRDFVSIYPAGRYYLFAAVLDAGGGDLLAVRATWALLRAAVVALVLVIGRRIMPLPWAVGAALAVLVLPGPWHKTFFPLVPLAVLAALGVWLESGQRRWLVAAGLAGGVGAWFRHDVGAVALAAAGMLVLADAFGRRRAPSLPGDVAALVVPALVALVGGFAWIAAQAGAAEVVDQLVWRAFAEGAPSLASNRLGLSWWLPRLALLLAMIWFGVASRALVRGGWSRREALLWAVALVALVTANQMFRFPVVIRSLQCGPVFWLLWFAAGAALAARRPQIAVLRPAAVVCGFGLPALAALRLLGGFPTGMPVEYTGTVAVRFARPEVFVLPGGGEIRVDRAWAGEVAFVTRALRELAPDGGPLAILGRPAAVYHLAGRRNPTRLIRFDDAATTAAERHAALRTLVERQATLVVDRRFLARRGATWAAALPRAFEVRRRRGPLLVLQPRSGPPGFSRDR